MKYSLPTLVKRTSFLACISGMCSLVSATAQADKQIVVPVQIHMAQAADEKSTLLQVEVQNTSTSTIIVDRNGLMEADFDASKSSPPNADGSINGLHTGSAYGSVGGRWSLDQLRRREPQRLITILPGKSFTLNVDATTLLKNIAPDFQHGKIEVQFTFHDFLLAVNDHEPSPELFNERVKADRIKIDWH